VSTYNMLLLLFSFDSGEQGIQCVSNIEFPLTSS
jgi:hypothetical protein